MVFSSMVFLWLFLPIVLAIYYLAGKRIKNTILLVSSLFFYAWGEPVYILLMLASIGMNWICGLAIEKYSRKKTILTVGCICNLLLLVYFKYFNLLVDTFETFLHKDFSVETIALPVGISFFTFQAMAYLIDLYRGHYSAQKNIFQLALYISFFPQLIAGPIERYTNIASQIEKREESIENFAYGVRRFIYGLGKKVIISNILAKCADNIFSLDISQVTGIYVWVGAICYTLQIYYDFSGYSDMAIGLGRMFGFKLMENFNYPYISKSITEFWRRWHISLSSWFRDYLYIPLGGNRKGKVRTYINLMIVFMVTGIWHGASWNFLLWGIYHGIFMLIEKAGVLKYLKKHGFLAGIYTLLIVNFGWVFFRITDIYEALRYICRMVMPWRYLSSGYTLAELCSGSTFFILVMAVLGCGFIQKLISRIKWVESLKGSYVEMVFCFVIALLSIMLLANNMYNPFIYFRF